MKKTFLLISLFLLSISFLKAQIPTNGLLIYYPFNGNANDASGNSNNGGVVGAVLTTDRFNNANSAYYFNKNVNHLGINCNGIDLNAKSFTLSAWATIESQTSSIYCPLITQGSETGNTGYSLGVGVNTTQITPSFSYNMVGGTTVFKQYDYNSDWHHYLVSYNYTTKTINLYVDGINVSTLSGITPFANGCYGSVNFGRSLGNGVSYSKLYGKLDDIRIYNRELSTSEITSVFNENKQEQTITFPSIPTQSIGSSDIVLPSTSDNGLEITYTSSNLSVATISGNILHIVGQGTTIIKATQSGNVTYKATTVTQTLNVGTTTAINNPSVQTFKVFPNPVKDKINIGNFINEKYSIVNQQGIEIKSGTIYTDFIDVSQLTQGLYFLQINNSNFKFIKE